MQEDRQQKKTEHFSRSVLFRQPHSSCSLIPRSMENPQLTDILLLRAGVGQNIAVHASPTDGNFVLVPTSANSLSLISGNCVSLCMAWIAVRCLLMHYMSRPSPRQIPVHILMSLANKSPYYPCIITCFQFLSFSFSNPSPYFLSALLARNADFLGNPRNTTGYSVHLHERLV